MMPESTATDGSISQDTRTLTLTELAVAAPIVNPINVTVKDDPSTMLAPEVTIITDEAVVAPHTPVSRATLLDPAATVGVTNCWKNPEGYVSVMLPPSSRGVARVKASVTGTNTLPATRSDDAILNETDVTCDNTHDDKSFDER